MSLLDDEDILITNLKKKITNPFFLLKQIFIRAHEDNNDILIGYNKDILNILKNIKIPERTKWYIDYRTVKLVDISYCGEPDNYKVFCSICISYDLEMLVIERKLSDRYRGSNTYNQIHDMFHTIEYELKQIYPNIFIYRDL